MLAATGGFWLVAIVFYLIWKNTEKKRSQNSLTPPTTTAFKKFQGPGFAQESARGAVFEYASLKTGNLLNAPFAIIDLVAILPFYLAAFFNLDLRALRVLRLLRLFKLLRAVYPAMVEFMERNRDKTLRQKVYAIVNETPDSGKLHEIFDFTIVIWVLISVTCVILESVQSINYYFHVEFIVIDTIAVAIFSTEFLMRIYSCTENPKYQHWLAGRINFSRQFSSLIDILAIAPFFLESLLDHLFDLRFLRVFRLMRLFKLGRYSAATKSLFYVIQREWPVMKASIFIMLMLVMLAACLGYLFEHEAQPDKFENIPQSIYWAVITLASVGYGDISPVTPAGRAITIVLALLGIGIFAIPAAILSSAFSDQLRIERETMKQELYEMLGDGQISPEERTIIDAEAKRLHLSKDEVDQLLEKAKIELGLISHPDQKGHSHHEPHYSHGHHESQRHSMDLNYLSKHPEAAGEQFKILLAQLQQLAHSVDHDRLNRYLSDKKHATDFQMETWEFISKQTKKKP
jgi:hypothetical protein